MLYYIAQRFFGFFQPSWSLFNKERILSGHFQPCPRQMKARKELNVYILRHAESSNNAKGAHDVRVDGASPAKKSKVSEAASAKQREPDPALTDRGIAQAEAAARLFSRIAKDPAAALSLRPSRIFVSGLSRALETCVPIARSLSLDPELEMMLHEEGGVFEGPRRGRGDGQWPQRHGLNAEKMRQLVPNAKGLESVPDKGWWRGDMEDSESVTVRANQCVEWLWSLADAQESPGAIICVSHGLFMDRWLKALLGMNPTDARNWFLTANCAYWLIGLRLDQSAAVPRQTLLLACNVVDHIPMSIRTGHNLAGHSHCQPSYSLEDLEAE